MLFILLILSLVQFTFLICPTFQVGAIASSDLSNLGTAVLTVIGLGVAFDVYMALTAHQTSVKDRTEDKCLEASRPQLQVFVDAATTQQEILNGNLEGSKARLGPWRATET